MLYKEYLIYRIKRETNREYESSMHARHSIIFDSVDDGQIPLYFSQSILS